jgi:hypothetical protein
LRPSLDKTGSGFPSWIFKDYEILRVWNVSKAQKVSLNPLGRVQIGAASR